MEIRYKSVTTFSTTVTKQSILEMAGWQISVVTSVLSPEDRRTKGLTARIRVDLPILVHGMTSEKNRKERSKVCCGNDGISDPDADFHVRKPVSGLLSKIMQWVWGKMHSRQSSIKHTHTEFEAPKKKGV